MSGEWDGESIRIFSQQKPSNPVHEISSRSLRRIANGSKIAKQCAYFPCRWSDFFKWDQRLIAGLFVKEVSQVELEFENDDRHAS